MGVAVIPLPNPVGGGRLALEVEARIDLVLAVWKEEVHVLACLLERDGTRRGPSVPPRSSQLIRTVEVSPRRRRERIVERLRHINTRAHGQRAPRESRSSTECSSVLGVILLSTSRVPWRCTRPCTSAAPCLRCCRIGSSFPVPRARTSRASLAHLPRDADDDSSIFGRQPSIEAGRSAGTHVTSCLARNPFLNLEAPQTAPYPPHTGVRASSFDKETPDLLGFCRAL